MTDCISTFFEAWQIDADSTRKDKISGAVVNSVQYDDPRTEETLIGLEALCDYIGMFTQNAPGWSAKVVAKDTISNYSRVTVAFGGPGPDGVDLVQHGQYFVHVVDERIAKMVGFAGLSVPPESS